MGACAALGCRPPICPNICVPASIWALLRFADTATETHTHMFRLAQLHLAKAPIPMTCSIQMKKLTGGEAQITTWDWFAHPNNRISVCRLSRFSGLVARPSPGPSHALLLFQSGRGAVRNGSLQIAFRKVLLRKAEKPHDHAVTRRGLRACCAVLCCVASVVFEAPENEAMCWLQTMEPCGADWTPSHAALSPKACFLPRPPSGRGRRIRQSH